MQRLMIAVMCLWELSVTGCLVTVETGGSGTDTRGGRPVGRPDDSATLAEIDAAAALGFDSDREKTFIGIALRPYLSAQAQNYLVHKGVRSLTFDSSRENVMLALVNNPHFLAEGKQAVLENLNLLTFESSKRKVLKAINQRGHVPSEREFYREMHSPFQAEREQ